jgi:hypothetical protein
MASTASNSLKLRKQGTGDNLNTWGGLLNTDVIDLIDEAVAQQVTISLTGNHTLTSTNYASNEARHPYIIFTDGGLASSPTVTAPGVENIWWIKNAGSTYAITFGVSGGTSVSIRPGSTAAVFSDGTDCEIYDQEAGDLKPPTAAFDMNSQKITSLADPTADQDGATKAYVDTEVAAVVSDAGAAAAASAAAAATSASNASTSETNAATSETNAAASAAAAATSETNAATSETNAAASAAEAASKISGPASATNNALVQFDGTTGKLAKNGPSIGTSANNLVQLDGSARLPAVDGSQLTGTGSLTLIDETEISTAVASVGWTSLATGTYKYFLVEIVEASLSATGYLRIQLSPDAGSTWRTTGYVGESVRGTIVLSETTGLATTNVNSITAADVQSGRFIVLEMASATKKTQMRGLTSYTASSAYRSTVAAYQYNTAEAHDSIRVIANTGNIDAGIFRLYGVN